MTGAAKSCISPIHAQLTIFDRKAQRQTPHNRYSIRKLDLKTGQNPTELLSLHGYHCNFEEIQAICAFSSHMGSQYLPVWRYTVLGKLCLSKGMIIRLSGLIVAFDIIFGILFEPTSKYYLAITYSKHLFTSDYAKLIWLLYRWSAMLFLWEMQWPVLSLTGTCSGV